MSELYIYFWKTCSTANDETWYWASIVMTNIKLNSVLAQIAPNLAFMTQPLLLPLHISNFIMSMTNFLPFFFRILKDNWTKNLVNFVSIVGKSSSVKRRKKIANLKMAQSKTMISTFQRRTNESFLWKLPRKHTEFPNTEWISYILTLSKLYKPFDRYKFISIIIY